MPYVKFTKEVLEEANNTDLEAMLRREGEKLKKSGSEWVWRDRSDAKINIRGCEWYHQYEAIGGRAIDFVRRFYNLDFSDAVYKLTGMSAAAIEEVPLKRPQDRKPFELPPAHSDMRRVFAYLMQRRFIDRDIISHFAHAHTLYEDAEHHNAVFIGCDENGNPRHAHKKSTSINDDSYRGNVTGCRPEFSFHHVGTSNRLYVYEAPIDMLAYLSLHKENWQRHTYVALCCVAEHAMLYHLKRNPEIDEVVICTDHDAAGIEAYHRLKEILGNFGYLNVRQELSEHKDWDEDLKALNGEAAIPAENHPQLARMQELCNELTRHCKGNKCPPNLKKKLADGYNRISTLTGQEQNYNAYAEEIQTQSFGYSAYAVWQAREMYRQLGIPVTTEQIVAQMAELYQPHKDKNLLNGKLADTKASLQAIGIEDTAVLTETEFKRKIEDVMRVGVDYLRINIFSFFEQMKNQNADMAPGLQMA